MPDKQLSILIPTIPSRKDQFKNLYDEVIKQIMFCAEYHWTLGFVEVLYDDSPAYLDGGPSIGVKRQKLIDRVTSNYLCFLDDDEGIAPNYVETLLRLCAEGADVCTFRNISKFDNYWCVVDLGLNHENEQTSPDRMVTRPPWHICPVKKEYAKLYKFDDTSYGEDWKWFSEVLKHCKTEAKSKSVIHQYNHSNKTSEADKITHEKVRS